MRHLVVVLGLFSWGGIGLAACGQDPMGSGGGAGGTPSCDGLNYVFGDVDGGNPCDICIREKCCAEANFCRDQYCIDCVSAGGGSHCPARADAVINCAGAQCADECHIHPPSGSSGTTTTTGAGGAGGT